MSSRTTTPPKGTASTDAPRVIECFMHSPEPYQTMTMQVIQTDADISVMLGSRAAPLAANAHTVTASAGTPLFDLLTALVDGVHAGEPAGVAERFAELNRR